MMFNAYDLFLALWTPQNVGVEQTEKRKQSHGNGIEYKL